MSYARPQWTGRPGGFSDDPALDSYECPSCLHFHAPSFVGCNGLREPCEGQCEAVLGEIRCHRPANHLREHEALGEQLRVEWEIL